METNWRRSQYRALATAIGSVGALLNGQHGGLVSISAAKRLATQGSVEKTIMDLERQWEKAAVESDAKAIDALIAPDFVTVQESGSLQNKADYIAGLLNQKIQTSSTTDMKVQVYGNTAVITALAYAKGTEKASGKPFEFRVRFADTWVKMPDGKWQCVASAGSPVK